MRQFMCNHSLKLYFLKPVDNTCCETNHAVLRIASCRKSVHRRIFDNINLGRRQPRCDAEVFNETINLATILMRHFLSAAHREHDLITPPIGAKAHND